MASSGEMSSIPPNVGSNPRKGARMGSAMARTTRTSGWYGLSPGIQEMSTRITTMRVRTSRT